MLHEPVAGRFDEEEWRRWLEAEKSSGRIGDFGIATEPERLAGFVARPEGPFGVVQAHDSLEHREADLLLDAGLPLQITFGYIGAALRANPAAQVADVLGAALERNSTGAIVVSTRRPERMELFGSFL